LHKQINGTITEVLGSATDGRGFPTFKLDSGTDIFKWQRFAHPGLFGTYPNDKFYQVGKRASITTIEQSIASTNNKYLDKSKPSETVIYVDVEE